MTSVIKTNFISTLVSFVMIFIFITLFFNVIDFTESMETCKSNLIIKNSTLTINSLILLHLLNNHGVIELHGFYTLKDGHQKKIERQISFELLTNKNKYILTESKIKANDDKAIIEEETSGLMPEFFLHDHSVLILDKKSSFGNEKAFLRSGLPFLYCFNNN